MSQVRYPALAELFQGFTGPFDRGPVQFHGHLTTGEYVYAKARETKVELEVYPTEADFTDESVRLAHYRQTVPYDAGVMAHDEFVGHIVRFLGQYVASKK
jgi:hypothetical protein